MPEQKYRKDLSVVDQDLLINKENKKIFRTAAYAMGIGVGFLIIIPILPEIADKEKMNGMIHVFNVISYLMIAYSFALAFGFFLLRPYIKLVQFVLNWIIVPTAGIWCLTEGYKVITG